MAFQSGRSGNRVFGGTRKPNNTGEDEGVRYLRELQGQNNGLDFQSLTRALGVQGIQNPLPALDFRWTWESRDRLQRGWALTFNSARGGLEMQRGRIEDAHHRMSISSLISHARDELILAFKTVTQTDQQAVFTNYSMIHTRFQNLEIMAPYIGTSAKLYAETSVSDPTVRLLSSTSATQIYSMGTAMIGGIEHLILMTNDGAYYYTGVDPLTAQTVGRKFQVVTGGSVGAVSIQSMGAGGNGVFGSPAWGTGQSSESFIGLAFIQSPIPGNPMIVRSSNAVLLVPVEASTANPNPRTQNARKILSNVGLGSCQALGFAAIGDLRPGAYWWETNTGSAASDGKYQSRIASTNAYGHDYQVHHMSMARIIGASLNRERGGIALTDGTRVVFWTGKEDDLGLFDDEAPTAGFRLFCTGFYSQDGDTFVEVNELPYTSGGVAQGRIRAQKRRYDFELQRWSPVSDWTTLTSDGLINWRNGIPVPVASGSTYGYMSAYGAPDLPFGDVTRAMHNYAVQARYNSGLTGTVAVSTSFDSTWNHKFEPPAATNPFSLRGGDQDYASSGLTRWPGLIFPPGFEYADKYFDLLDVGGQDTGGTSSSWTIRLGEGGRMDETNPGPLHHTFRNPLSHADRRYPFPTNQTAVLFPQVEVEMTGGSDATLTPQALPFTVYGHVDLPKPPTRRPWLPGGRSRG